MANRLWTFRDSIFSRENKPFIFFFQGPGRLSEMDTPNYTPPPKNGWVGPFRGWWSSEQWKKGPLAIYCIYGMKIIPNYNGDYFINHDIRIPCLINQDDSWKVKGPGFLFVAQVVKHQPVKLRIVRFFRWRCASSNDVCFECMQTKLGVDWVDWVDSQGWSCAVEVALCSFVPSTVVLLGQWLNFKLFGITYLVGKIKFKLCFSGSIG